jgi:hypothetical protein
VHATVIDELLARLDLVLVLVGVMVLDAFDIVPDVVWIEHHLVGGENDWQAALPERPIKVPQLSACARASLFESEPRFGSAPA